MTNNQPIYCVKCEIEMPRPFEDCDFNSLSEFEKGLMGLEVAFGICENCTEEKTS